MKRSTWGWTGAALLVAPLVSVILKYGLPWWWACLLDEPFWTVITTSAVAGIFCLCVALPNEATGRVPATHPQYGSDVHHRPDPQSECPIVRVAP
jgi:hypothetical protein